LAELAAKVFSIERIDILAKKARSLLDEFGYKNIYIKVGDGTFGWPEFAPFDKIIVTASPFEVPRPLIDELSEGGKMVIPIGSRFAQRLVLLEKKKEGNISEEDICGCVFVPLIGEYGWKE
jgi:protein-L-isoaspartate(D-aspartate) O-methyltransferase